MVGSNKKRSLADSQREADNTIKQTIATPSLLKEDFKSNVNSLIQALSDTESTKKSYALQWSLFVNAMTNEIESTSSKSEYNFPNNWMMRVVEGIVFKNGSSLNNSATELLDAVAITANQMDDVRFYLYRDIARCLTRCRNKGITNKKLIDLTQMIQFLQSLTAVPTDSRNDKNLNTSAEFSLLCPKYKDASNIPNLTQHKKEFSEAWLSLLRLPLSEEQHKLILSDFHLNVIPNMHQPVLLVDYLSDLYSIGMRKGTDGVLSVLALNGLFLLITKHNLDYPDFYKHLYALLTPETFKLKYWSRFFRLLSSCLSSTHVPAYLIASFIKRLAKTSLSVQPNACMAIIALIYNLIKMHPACVVLVHRDGKNGGGSVMEDKYDYTQTDPSITNALQSSLWELQALKQHYYPDVVRLSTILQTSLTKEPYDIEEFINHTGGIESHTPCQKYQDKEVVLELIKNDVSFGCVWTGWA